MRYQDAGVDIDRAVALVRGIAAAARTTWGPRVLSDAGSYGGLFDAADLGPQPILVSSVDGVGTKAQVARAAGDASGLGTDLVHHCVNDILVQGARPLFFLDYLAASRLDPAVMLPVVESMAAACRAHECALLGGETAEMPGTYTPGDYDVVGCIVGVTTREYLLTGERIVPGDVLWGLPSSGLHTNGYSLARRVLLETAELPLDRDPGGLGTTLGAALLAPHRSYFQELWPLVQARRIHGLAHLTGGGFVDNLPRVLPSGCDAEIEPGAWEVPPLFRLIQERGDVPADEMRRVFNLGIGMVVFAPPDSAAWLPAACPGAVHLGRVLAGSGNVRFTDAA